MQGTVESVKKLQFPQKEITSRKREQNATIKVQTEERKFKIIANTTIVNQLYLT